MNGSCREPRLSHHEIRCAQKRSLKELKNCDDDLELPLGAVSTCLPISPSAGLQKQTRGWSIVSNEYVGGMVFHKYEIHEHFAYFLEGSIAPFTVFSSMVDKTGKDHGFVPAVSGPERVKFLGSTPKQQTLVRNTPPIFGLPPHFTKLMEFRCLAQLHLSVEECNTVLRVSLRDTESAVALLCTMAVLCCHEPIDMGQLDQTQKICAHHVYSCFDQFLIICNV